jgi:large subunit ribosomal protein L4
VATLKKYDFMGKEIGKESLEESLLLSETNEQLVKDYIIALRNNARQWSANTKTRSEVNDVKQKPQQQKGLGRARQGFLGAPQFKGGGRVFGPRPKFDQHWKINKKSKRLVIQSLLSEKIKDNKVCVLEAPSLEKPKTKMAFEFFKKLELDSRKVLVIGNTLSDFSNLMRSLRNIPKKYYTFVTKINGYELANCQDFVIMSSALDGIKGLLSNKVGE